MISIHPRTVHYRFFCINGHSAYSRLAFTIANVICFAITTTWCWFYCYHHSGITCLNAAGCSGPHTVSPSYLNKATTIIFLTYSWKCNNIIRIFSTLSPEVFSLVTLAELASTQLTWYEIWVIYRLCTILCSIGRQLTGPWLLCLSAPHSPSKVFTIQTVRLKLIYNNVYAWSLQLLSLTGRK